MESAELATAEQLAKIRSLRSRRLFRRWLMPLGIVVLSVAGFSVMKGSRPPPEKKEVTERALLVRTEPIQPSTVRMTVSSQGMVIPRTATALVAEVSGKVVAVSPRMLVGGFFESGEEILRIDPSDYEVALKRAQSTLAANKARLAQEQAQAEQAALDWAKLEGRRGDQAPDLVLRKPQLAEAAAAVRFAEADVEKAQRDLDRTRIRAPYDALLREKAADIGQFVAVGTVLGNLVAVDSAEVRLPVSSDQMAYLYLQDGLLASELQIPVELSVDLDGQQLTWQSNIVRAEGVVDERTRLQYLVARIEDPYGRISGDGRVPLQIGQFVSARISGIQADNVIKLPRHLLRPDNTVLVTGTDRTLRIADVDVMRQDAEFAYVQSGLQATDQVIASAVPFPVEGMQLRIEGDPVEDPDGADADAAPEVELASDGAL